MAIVQDRLNANKPPPPTGDPKTGKLAPGQINNNKDLDVDIKKEEPSFFGSFFARDKTVKKKGVAAMDSVGVGIMKKRALRLNIDGIRFFLPTLDSFRNGSATSCYSPASRLERTGDNGD